MPDLLFADSYGPAIDVGLSGSIVLFAIFVIVVVGSLFLKRHNRH